jgi:hypothetical protein
LEKIGREDAKLLKMIFFSFCQKIKDGKAGWQIVGDVSMLYVQLVHQFPMLKHGKLAISATNIVRLFFSLHHR